jgi:predicted dienelactone hydrolase
MEPRTFEARDDARGRTFPIDVWEPAGAKHPPLVVYSHASMQHRRSAAFLCRYLCSHGYAVAAMDHSETVALELRRPASETEEQKRARWQAIIDSRVPDIRFLLDTLGAEAPVGIVGHSFGGWTALAVPDVEPRIGAIVALAPGGASNPRPFILPVTLRFKWKRDIPTLLIAAEYDTSLPLDGMFEIFDRIPSTKKKMAILHRADHMHFMDDIEKLHEMFRTAEVPPEMREIQKEMLPMSELMTAEEAHRLVSEWTLARFDEFLQSPADG